MTKKHSLLKLTSQIYNTPHLITPESFEVVLNYLNLRNSGNQSLMLPMSEQDDEELPDDLDDFDESPLPIVVINIDGSLTYKPVMTMCGEAGTSYCSITDDVEEAIEAGAETIIFNISSGGGQASHVFEVCEDIRTMCDEAGVKLIGYADTMACSAAYALAVICDELYANPSASIGSIGCVVALCDMSKAMDMAGVKNIYITSGANKVPFDESGAFKESFIEDIQSDVDKLNTQFCDFVSKYSSIDSKIIRGFEAGVFDANEALDKGLVMGIMTNKEFVKYIVSQVPTMQGVEND